MQGVPRWRHTVQTTPLDVKLFPLHSPVNYVNWLGAQKKRVVALSEEQEGPRYGPGESGGLRSRSVSRISTTLLNAVSRDSASCDDRRSSGRASSTRRPSTRGSPSR